MRLPETASAAARTPPRSSICCAASRLAFRLLRGGKRTIEASTTWIDDALWHAVARLGRRCRRPRHAAKRARLPAKVGTYRWTDHREQVKAAPYRGRPRLASIVCAGFTARPMSAVCTPSLVPTPAHVLFCHSSTDFAFRGSVSGDGDLGLRSAERWRKLQSRLR